MHVFFYDQSFDGLLSAIFDAYQLKVFPDQLLAYHDLVPLLVESTTNVQTDADKAQRVWNAVRKKASGKFCHKLMYAWLSEEERSDLLIFNVIRKLVDSKQNLETAYGDTDMLALHQLTKRVAKELCFLMQFVRFQKTRDDIYFSPVEPACNVLPVAISYFKDRFSDQKWILYDIKRDYGFFYNLQTVKQIRLDQDAHFVEDGKLKPEALSPDEILIQKMWKKYFKSVTITERRNLKQQRQYMPQRFWHLLPEM